MLLRGVGLGEDQRDLGDVAERDPHLRAADRPAAVGLGRAGAEVGGVGAGVGLGQAEAAEPLARAEPRQPLLLLLLGAPLLDRAGDQRGLDRDDGAGGGVGAADLLDDQPVADVVEAAAAVLFGDRGAEEADLAELARQLAVEAPVAVVVAGAREDLALGELPRRLADQLLLVAQLEVHLTPSLRCVAKLAQSRPASRRRPPGPPACAGPGRAGKVACRRPRRRPGSRAWSRRGTPRRRRAGRRRASCPLRRASALIIRSRVIDSRTPSSSAGVRSSPSAETQKIEEVGGSSTVPSGRTSTASSAPLPLAIRVACMFARVGERLDPVEDHRRAVGDGGEADASRRGRGSARWRRSGGRHG